MAKDFLNPQRPKVVKIIPKPKTTNVGVIVPAGARELALAEAMLAGRAPIVSLNDTVWAPDVIDTVLSPERSAVGVQDQLPEVLAVADTVCVPTVPETAALAVVTPENVGRAEVTQKCFAP